MAIKLGSSDISDIRLGDKQVSAVYVGDKLVWEKVQGIRYIRDHVRMGYWQGNSTAAFTEIKAFDANGNNIALGKNVTTNGVLSDFYAQKGFTLKSATDNNINTGDGGGGGGSFNVDGKDTNLVYLQVDLGGVYDIKKITRWHSTAFANKNFDTKTEVSADGVNWRTVFDSAVSGTYAETAQGHTITL